jgi:siroheme synthase
MARRTAAELAGKLLARGVSATTPAIIATNVSRPDETAMATTLGGLAQGAARGEDVAPTLVLIGAACGAAGLPADTVSTERAASRELAPVD